MVDENKTPEVKPTKAAKAEKIAQTAVDTAKEVANTLGIKEEAPVEGTPVENKFGIQETKDVIIFLARLGHSVAHCAITKKWILTEFMDDAKALPAALTGISQVPAEIKDINSKEVAELIAAVMNELAPLGIKTTDAAKKFVLAGIHFAEGALCLIQGLEATKAK